MTFSEETLMAYADEELDAQTRSAVEAAMAADPEIARRVERHKALRARVHGAFDKVLDEPPPQRLIDTARGIPALRREGNVIPLRRRAPPRRAIPQWMSIAASLVIGVFIGQTLLRMSGTAPIGTREGKLVANGVLAQALSEQLASTQRGELPVWIGLTFKSKDGDYCRTFTLRESSTLAGIACREGDTWQVQTLAQSAQPTTTPGGSYRQAASSVPHTVTQAVEEIIAGDPLDAAAEKLARDQNWTRR